MKKSLTFSNRFGNSPFTQNPSKSISSKKYLESTQKTDQKYQKYSNIPTSIKENLPIEKPKKPQKKISLSKTFEISNKIRAEISKKKQKSKRKKEKRSLISSIAKMRARRRKLGPNHKR